MCVEAAPEDSAAQSRCRADLSFRLGDGRYDLELKTPNSNWRMPGVAKLTRPITKNLAEIVADARKLLRDASRGIMAFVLFPVPVGEVTWHTYLERIASELRIPITPAEHTARVDVPLGEGNAAEAIVCCFAVPPNNEYLDSSGQA